MKSVPNVAIPLFLFACLLLGGSAQGVWGIFLLQAAGLSLLAWSLNARAAQPMPQMARALLILAGCSLALAMAQIVPLPPGIWTALPGRGTVVEGLSLLKQQPDWMSLSLNPYETLEAAFALIVPIAIFTAMVRRPEGSRRMLVAALLAATFAGCVLGVLQISGGDQWYLYRFSAFGSSTGFFANSNHMGTLLIATAPFLVAMAADGADRNRNAEVRAVIKAVAVAGAGLLIVSIVINQSLAVQILVLPVTLACLAMAGWGRAPNRRRILLIGALLVIVAGLAVAAFSTDRMRASTQESLSTRTHIWETSERAIANVGLAGSGLGTFPQYYRQFEDPGSVTQTFVNHAHNDYLELIVEGGAAAGLLILLFLAWWVFAALRCWRDPEADAYARAGSVASAAILLHSLVDYPLRTAGIAALFAMSLALMCLRPASSAGSERRDLRPTRHRAIR